MLRYRSNEYVKPVIDDNDPSVTYSGDWRTDNSYAATYFHAYDSTIHYTLQPNANASISYYGSYITLFVIIPSILDLKNVGFTTAGLQLQLSYQFDDGPPGKYTLTMDANFNLTTQLFFQPSTTQLDGHHTLFLVTPV
ncbi:hypothetical protein M378DRAFT_181747 [Amanita muscaria Koide BX008]|uniref:Uncharacterized protein n=1 Tax=Amanita muscaria (strain Koide BX008) TaxID=946122 RepID=A0A0C2W7I2_AMAMK|nr:hypothetical protein M378DRAFT_181747 [Amanita muscaria Koide BX008]